MNPHPDYRHETIPTKIFKTLKGRNIELCFSCYEDEQNKAKFNNTNFIKGHNYYVMPIVKIRSGIYKSK